MTCIATISVIDAMFERQIEAFAQRGDVAVGADDERQVRECRSRSCELRSARGATTIALLAAARSWAAAKRIILCAFQATDTAHHPGNASHDSSCVVPGDG